MKFNKSNEFISKYLAYDLYFSNQTNYHEMPLMSYNSQDKTRLQKIQEIIQKIDVVSSNNRFTIQSKKFYLSSETSTIFSLSKLVYEDINI